MASLKVCSFATFKDKMYVLAGAAIVIGLILTIVSLLRLCSESCAEGHNYLLFGMKFEVFGLIFFVTLFAIHLLQRKYENLQHIESLLFAGGLGAEVMFIIIQKYYIGTWCPVCLGIAACIGIGAGSFGAIYAENIKTLVSSNWSKGEIMKSIWKGLTNTSAVFVGFFIAFIGISKYDAIKAAQDSITDSLAFGNRDSNIEVYVFTDWACPACRKLEPNLKEITEAISKDAKVIFVDHVVHPETLNFIPFHLSFILKNKDKYFPLRDMLTQISEKTGAPTESEISTAAAKLGVQYNELNYSDIALAIKYYKELADKFKVKGTPTMVVINRESKKGKKLSGNGEISKENAIKAIQVLKAA